MAGTQPGGHPSHPSALSLKSAGTRFSGPSGQRDARTARHFVDLLPILTQPFLIVPPPSPNVTRPLRDLSATAAVAPSFLLDSSMTVDEVELHRPGRARGFRRGKLKHVLALTRPVSVGDRYHCSEPTDSLPSLPPSLPRLNFVRVETGWQCKCNRGGRQ